MTNSLSGGAPDADGGAATGRVVDPRYPDPPQHPTTLADAERVNPIELAQRVGDVFRWLGPEAFATEVAPLDPRRLARRDLELEKLATVRALHAHLGAITASRIHQAVISGATAEQITAATGLSVAAAAEIWAPWAAGQRRLEADLPHLPQHAAQYDHVARVLDATG
ncbi:hypothetical protein [Actinoplanes sp. G11-F43]|uniref:hypothetical protein n=1 Tax=Actinoplanes sp. G11-F43 TaxID=3424130 RepID=UPI003D33B498